MNKAKLIFITCTMLVSVVFCLSCGKSTNDHNDKKQEPNTVADPVGYKGPLQGKVEDEETLKLAEGEDLETSIRDTNLGKLWLTYPKSGNKEEVRIEVPSDAFIEVNAYFKAYLKFCLIPNKDEGSESDENVKRDMTLLKKANEVKNRVKEIEIDAPDGRRKISEIEADRLIEFVGNSAISLCKPMRKGA